MTDWSRRRLGRRPFLAGLAAAAGSPFLATGRARAQVGPAVAVGGITVRPISDGTRSMPTAIAWPEAPPDDLAALLGAEGPPPEAIPMPNNVTLIETADRRVLVDAGSGPNFDPSTGRLEEALLAEGIEPESITDLVLTHGHPDHLWGALDDFEEFPRFPNARHIITESEHAYWLGPPPPDAPAFHEGMALGAARVLEAIDEVLERVSGEVEVAPGVTLLPTPGHTPGHVSVRVDDGDAGLLILGDALTHAVVSFQRPGWRLATDADPDAAAATRTRLLDMLGADGLPVIGFHLPWPGIGRVERSGDSYAFAPI
jgi:glyoxylase-like metal-dependent hydrolase (beta-lactamase superfamily II)